jgi:hypothetical protein
MWEPKCGSRAIAGPLFRFRLSASHLHDLAAGLVEGRDDGVRARPDEPACSDRRRRSLSETIRSEPRNPLLYANQSALA